MKTVKVDSNGDRITENGLFVYLYDLDALTQTCEQTMKTQVNQLQYDQTKGIEYFNNVFTGNANLQLFEAQAREQLLKLGGVTSIASFTYSQIDNELSYTATINTIYGDITINA